MIDALTRPGPTEALEPIDRWLKDAADDQQMTDDHEILWDRLIDMMTEQDLTGASILDYGCNTGGLLQRLYGAKPFAHGVGVDLALGQVAQARKHRTDGPYDFAGLDYLDRQHGVFDLAMSHEVIYLLPDLDAHARLMRRVLKPGGVYYAATGCHTANPRWPEWRTIIAASAHVTPGDYAPEDYSAAFERAGFTVGVQPYRLDRFVPFSATDPLFRTVADALDYYQHHKLVFRFQRDDVPVEVAS